MAGLEPISEAAVTLTVDAPDLYAGDMLTAVGALLHIAELLSEGTENAAEMDWVVDTISKASPFAVALAPKPRNRMAAEAAPDITRRIVRGLSLLQETGERPSDFSDPALIAAREMSRLTRRRSVAMQLAAPGEHATITRDVGHAVDRILAPSYHAYGSVEGRLDAINVHRDRYFFVYDALTGDSIRCSFTRSLRLEQVAQAITERVLVEGEISYRRDGSIASVRAEALRIFPGEADLPTAREVLGILKP